MFKLAKLVFGVSTLAIAVLFSACYLNPSQAGRLEAISFAKTAYHAVSAQANSAAGDASLQLPANMHGFTATASAFVDSNLATAALQLKSMRASIAGNVSALSWLRPDATSVQQATQDASIGAHNLARKMPTVSALRSNMDHLSDLHPTLSSANIGF
jgi:hypothetical protein